MKSQKSKKTAKNEITHARTVHRNLLLGVLFGLILIGAWLLNLIFPVFHYEDFDPRTTIPLYSFQIQKVPNSSQITDAQVPTTGCNAQLTIPRGQPTYITITSDDLKRRFIVYLPPTFNNSVAHPLILAFHGYNSTPAGFEQYIQLNALAHTKGFIVVYPEGTSALGGARGWNTGLRPTIKANDVLFVSNILNTLQTSLCINAHQIYATGFSNGGGFVADLACKMSNRIAAFAPVSGSYLDSFFKSCTPKRGVPILEFHGNADSIVPYSGLPSLKEVSTTYWLDQWAKRDSCDPKPIQTQESKQITKYVWKNCKDNVSLIHYKIIGEGHQWPHVQFQNIQNGHVVALNTEQTIWNFFQSNQLP